MEKLQNWVQQGNTTLTIGQAAGVIARKVQGSYPGATVTVYINSAPAVAISSISRTANVVTVTIAAGSGFIAGEQVTIAGVTDASFNGTFTILTSGATTFTYAQTAANASSSGGTATSTLRLATIYSDNASTAKANPFVSASDGTWFFYAPNGTYDVKFSGAGIAAPFTLGGFTLFDESIIWIDASSSKYGSSSATMDVRLNAALADIPSTGGVVDARGINGVQSLTATVTISKPVDIIFGFGVFTSTADPAFNITHNNVSLHSASEASQSTNSGSNATVLATTNTTGSIIVSNSVETAIKDITLRYSGAAARTAGSGILCRSGCSLNVENIKIETTWIGINMAEGASSGVFRNVLMNSFNAGAGAAWHAAMVLGGCTAAGTPAALGCNQAMTGVVTDTHFDNIEISQDANFASGAVVILDGGTDTISFNKIEIISSGTCRTVDCGALMLFQNSVASLPPSFDPPRWIRVMLGAFEGAISNATSPVIDIGAAKDVRFIGFTGLSGGRAGFRIKAGTRSAEYTNDVEIAQGSFSQNNRECVSIESPAGKTTGPYGLAIGNVYIHHNSMGGSSQETNGGFNAINIGADNTYFYITDNHFEPLFTYAKFPARYINIAAGGSDQYIIQRNQFNPTYRTVTSLTDGGSGSVKIIGPNLTGPTAMLESLYGGYLSVAGYGPITLPTAASVQINGGGGGTDAVSVAFSDGSGRSMNFGYVGGGAFNPKFRIWDTGVITLPTVAFANLNIQGTTANGTVFYCSDCTIANPCGGGGTGALAKRIGGVWICN